VKIDAIAFEHFRCHESWAIEPGPVTVFTGPNGSGKSTLVHGLAYLLAGSCALTDERGRGGELAERGHAKGSVTIQSGDATATRDTNGHLALSWARAGQRDSQRELETQVGCTAERARLCLEGGRFLEWDGKRQSGFLQDLLHTHPTNGRVEEELDRLDATTGLPCAAVARQLIGQSLANLGRSHTLCYEERTVVNRRVKELAVRLDELEETGQGIAFVSADEVAGRQSRKEAAEATLDSAQARLSELERSRSAANHAQAKLATEREALSRLEAIPAPTDTLDRAEEKRGMVRKQLDTLREALVVKLREAQAEQAHLDEHNRAVSRYGEVEARIGALQAEIESGGVCHWAKESPCAGAAARTAAARSQLAQAQAELIEAGAWLDANVSIEPGARVLALREECDALRARIQKGEARLREADGWVSAAARYATTQAQIDERRRHISELEAQAANLEGVLEAELASQAFEDARQAYNACIDACEDAGKWLVHQKALSDLKTRLTDQKTRQACLENLVALFREDGLGARVLAEGLQPFQDALNAVLRRWGMAARHDLHLRLEVYNGRAWVPYEALSDGEALLVSLAHQVAFARLTGLGIVCVDRLEALDDERQDELLRACVEIAGEPDGPDHILLFGVRLGQVPVGVTHVKLERSLAVAA
jgi:DNA repair exonuclease SbcCD ATPase subunit